MHFDYTYILLFGVKVFEPVVLLTNTLFFLLSVLCFQRLNHFAHAYARQMGRFMLFLGISSLFGGLGHAVHFQLGEPVLDGIVFLMNTFSLLSIYYFFRGSYTFLNQEKESRGLYNYIVMAWVLILLVACGLKGNFLLIKIHAGIVLLFALVAHYLVYRRFQDRGSGLVVLGILISFLPILVHSLKLSFHEWFNHKDLAHVIMIVSLLVIYRGVRIVSGELEQLEPAPAV